MSPAVTAAPRGGRQRDALPQRDRPRRGAAADTLAQAERRPEPLVREKRLFLRVGGEHYYNDAVRGDRSRCFLDASLSGRMKRLELALECRNLLGTETYSSASYSDITTYVYTYRLRPLTALLKIRFTL